MNWKTIRLELAGTREFPSGSAGRAFLLRLPLDEDGSINEAELAQRPSRATVRRFWASEPDCSGRITRRDDGWDLSCSERHDDGFYFHLPPQQILPGGQIVMTTPDGTRLTFRVANMTKLG
jgi:hypothetical protein